MIRAYREIYLNKAQSTLGGAFDYAVNDCGLSGDDFTKLFSMSTVSKRMENGEPSVLAGKSGVEIAIDVLSETLGNAPAAEPSARYDRSCEYWIGWTVAYYQWYSSKPYTIIFDALPFSDLQTMYPVLHEADISKFVEIADERVRAVFCDTNLKRIRTAYGYTQAELAERSGVGLRSIQMYEQRQKDINKASVETMYFLAKTLGCTIEDLIER